MNIAEAGWYQDPANPLNQRFWNGSAWTEQVRSGASQSNFNSGPDWSGITSVNNYAANNFQPNNAPQNFATTFSAPSGNSQSDLAPRAVNMIDAFTRAFKKYVDFQGRASKSEFWFFYLWVFIFSWIPILNIFWLLATFIPLLAVGTRRLHDIGKPGIYWLFSFIPFVGFIVMIVFWATDAERNDNLYGPAR